jgi:hypothetical protein
MASDRVHLAHLDAGIVLGDHVQRPSERVMGELRLQRRVPRTQRFSVLCEGGRTKGEACGGGNEKADHSERMCKMRTGNGFRIKGINFLAPEQAGLTTGNRMSVSCPRPSPVDMVVPVFGIPGVQIELFARYCASSR